MGDYLNVAKILSWLIAAWPLPAQFSPVRFRANQHMNGPVPP